MDTGISALSNPTANSKTTAAPNSKIHDDNDVTVSGNKLTPDTTEGTSIPPIVSSSSSSSFTSLSSISSSSSSSSPVRTASAKDALIATAILQKAFANDPVFDYLCRNDEYRGTAINNLFTTTFYESLRNNLAYVISHPSQATNIAGVALWYPPSAGAVVSTYGTWLTYAGIWKLLRIAYVGIQIELAHPKEPCYYLFAVGIDPLAQGLKLAGTLLREVLRKADDEKIPCYLENSNPKNTPIYEHLGFRSVKSIYLGKNAPPLTAMWREVGGGKTTRTVDHTK